MTKELLDKYLNNQCSPDELKQVLSWLSSMDLSGERERLMHTDWTNFDLQETGIDFQDDSKFTRILDNIHYKLERSQRIAGTQKVSRMVGWLTKAAAVLFIPVLSILLYTLYQQAYHPDNYAGMPVDSVEVSAPIGSITTVTLSDGTRVHLNYGSKIEYPRVFAGKKRELRLTGEGFFEVAHNPAKPFVVRANGLNVRVLGTKFNVRAYPEQDLVSTTLVEGKVELEQCRKAGEEKPLGAMIPGQHVDYYTDSGKMLSSVGNVEKYTGWKDGLLVFENSGIDEVTERLGRKFNVDFVVDGQLKDLTYTVTFINEPLSQILELMQETTPIAYKISSRLKLPDGSYSKQIITINKR